MRGSPWPWRADPARAGRWNSGQLARVRARPGPSRMASMRTPDSSSRNCDPASVRAHSTIRRSSERWCRSTRPWRSTRATNPLDAVELRSKTSAIRPIGCGPFAAEQEEQPDLAERQVPVGRRRRWHLARHRMDDAHQVERGRGQRVVGGPGSVDARTVRWSMLHAREDGTRRREVSSTVRRQSTIRGQRRSADGFEQAQPSSAPRVRGRFGSHRAAARRRCASLGARRVGDRFVARVAAGSWHPRNRRELAGIAGAASRDRRHRLLAFDLGREPVVRLEHQRDVAAQRDHQDGGAEDLPERPRDPREQHGAGHDERRRDDVDVARSGRLLGAELGPDEARR